MVQHAPTVPAVTEHDYRNPACTTAPNPRPLLLADAKKDVYKQHHRRLRWLMHNHPSGDPTPSQADIAMTKEIVSVAQPLGISVHDHIIVGKDGHASLKGLRLI